MDCAYAADRIGVRRKRVRRPGAADEGPGSPRPENSMAFNGVAELFLARPLGGRHEAISEDIKQSSLTVPVGGEDIQGLMEIMQKREPESPAQ